MMLMVPLSPGATGRLKYDALRHEHEVMTRVTQRHRAVVGEGEFAHQIAALAGHVAEIVARDLHMQMRPLDLRGLLGAARRKGQASEKCQ